MATQVIKSAKEGCPNCGPSCSYHQPPVTLQLLIIDLEDCCVVKVEKGYLPDNFCGLTNSVGEDNTVIIYGFLADLRTALDDAPVPRIERHNSYTFSYNFHYPTGSAAWRQDEYDAISELCGKALPIWEGNGKWTNLIDDCSCNFQLVPVGIWRYSR